MSDIEKLLDQIADHDWRVSHLAHTSSTAFFARCEIQRLSKEVEDLRAIHGKLILDASRQLNEARAATIEECAKVAESFGREGDLYELKIAEAIRALHSPANAEGK